MCEAGPWKRLGPCAARKIAEEGQASQDCCQGHREGAPPRHLELHNHLFPFSSSPYVWSWTLHIGWLLLVVTPRSIFGDDSIISKDVNSEKRLSFKGGKWESRKRGINSTPCDLQFTYFLPSIIISPPPSSWRELQWGFLHGEGTFHLFIFILSVNLLNQTHILE